MKYQYPVASPHAQGAAVFIPRKFRACLVVAALLLFAAVPGVQAVLRISNGTGGGTYATGATWSNGAPGTTDTIEILAGDTVSVGTATSVAGVLIDHGGTLATPAKLTVNHGTSPDVDIHGTWDCTIGSGLTLGSGATIAVESDGTFIYDLATGTIIGGTVSAATMTVNGTVKVAANVSTTLNIPTATWASTSTLLFTGETTGNSAIGGMSQTFGNVTWNCTSQTTGVPSLLGTAAGTYTFAGNFNVLSTGSGVLNLANISSPGIFTLNIGGSLSVASGATLSGSTKNTTAAINAINFTGTGALNISGTYQASSTAAEGEQCNWTINSGASITLGANWTMAGQVGQTGAHADTLTVNGTLNCSNFNILNTSVASDNNTFTVASGATLITGSTDGTGALATSGAHGSIQVNGTRTFNSGASYTFNGVSAQVSGNGLPSVVNNLVDNNASGVTLSATETVNGKLGGSGTISSGIVTNTANGGVSPGNSPGTLTVATLQLNAGSTNLFEITNSATTGSGINDEVVIGTGGVLAPHGASITISNYGTVAIDNGTDILLVDYTAGTISGPTFTNIPIWVSALSNAPGTIATIVDDSAGHIKLHVAAAAPPPAGIFITNQPSTTVAGLSIAPAVLVAATNADGSPYVSQTTITISKIAGSGTLSGTVSKITDPVTGIATFNDLSINLIGTDKQLQAANPAGGFTVNSTVFTVTPANPSQLGLGTQPTAGNAGVAFSPQPVVTILDPFGNLTASSASVTVTQNTGGTLQGTLSVNAVSGTASFSGLFATNVGTIKLNYTSSGLTSTNSGNITMSAGADAALAITTSIGAQQVDGTQFTPTPTVTILDAYSNLTASTASVTPHLASGTGGALQGADAGGKAAVAGTATFSALHFNLANPATAEPGVQVYYTSGSLTTTTNASFTVNPAIQVTFLTQPTGTNAGSVIESAVPGSITVLVSNTSTATIVSNATVIMTVGTGTGSLHGTVSQISDVNGNATFNDLVLNVAGNKTLRATTLGTTANSSSFWISPNSATALQVLAPGETNAPDNGGTFKGGTPINQNKIAAFAVTVNAIDNFGNTDTNKTDAINVVTSDANDTEPANAALVAGAQSFSITAATTGSDTITATNVGGSFTASTTVTINAPPAYRSKADGNWTTTATWEVSTNNGSSYVPATSTPTSANAGSVEVTNARAVTLNSAVSVQDLTIDAGGAVQVQNAGALTIADDAGAPIDCDVLGTLQGTNGSAITTTGALKFENGGQFLWVGTATAAIPTATWATNSTCNIAPGAAATVSTTPATGLNQVFGNFVWNWPNQSGSAILGGQNANPLLNSLNGTLTNIQGDFELTCGGAFCFGAKPDTNTAVAINVGGTIKVHAVTANFLLGTGGTERGTYLVKVGKGVVVDSGGKFDFGNPNGGTGNVTLEFAGSGQYSTTNVTVGNPNSASFVVDSGATIVLNSAVGVNAGKTFEVDGTLNFGTNNAGISGTGIFTNIPGSTLGITSLAGVTASGATGNIQTTTRALSTGANYVYSGGAAQVIGNGLPATVANLTLAAGMTNFVTVSNTVATATPDITVTGTLAASGNSIAYTVAGSQIHHGTYGMYGYGALTGNLSLTPALVGGSSAAATVTTNGGVVNLVVPNTPPVATATNYNHAANISFKIAKADLLASDVDVDGDTLTFVSFSSTNANITSDGSNIYVPGNTVNESFTYTISDGNLGTNTGLVTLTVVSVNGPSTTITPTPSNATATFFGIPGQNYFVERATNVGFTLGVSNFPATTTPSNGIIVTVDSFSDLGTVPSSAFYRLVVP